MSDQKVRLDALLDDLASGRLSTADVAARIRGMNWPRMHGKTAFQTRAADALNELNDPPPEGSFADVAHAYHTGQLDYRQFEQLQRAYTEAIGGAEQQHP